MTHKSIIRLVGRRRLLYLGIGSRPETPPWPFFLSGFGDVVIRNCECEGSAIARRIRTKVLIDTFVQWLRRCA